MGQEMQVLRLGALTLVALAHSGGGQCSVVFRSVQVLALNACGEER
ncbi:hypothetical protein Q31a_38360 [Aureliella helgolandensis]|uniref:Uncharacterized protein n=1 Tax=Aureliella helgolandensis TaxID=2527968 RepID=A0A518GAA9_9BACT|nr:hypothetical protein Q31a_38360 [Aureliella helgolandensis]